MSFERDNPMLSFVPIDEATVPPGGIINHYKDRWWAVCPERGVVFHRANKRSKSGSPQCNGNEVIARKVIGGLYPWAEIRFIPSVFVRININDYV